MISGLRVAFFVHSICSDWNNGNAHYLRGLVRALGSGHTADASVVDPEAVAPQGHDVTVFEPEQNWSSENLLTESKGTYSLAQFHAVYPDIHVERYAPGVANGSALRASLAGFDVVVVHEWNPPELIAELLELRDELGFRALFHDTHHRASSTPEQIRLLQVERFDGVLAFGEALRQIYQERFGIAHVWTLHEAADTTVFFPRKANAEQDVVWVGNWGDDERSAEIRSFLVQPAAALADRRFCIYGVRYPEDALRELDEAGVSFGGYLPNLDAPAQYAAARLTVHIPRQYYAAAMTGIPTIRVFEALASGIPLISAPWIDSEALFEPGEFLLVRDIGEMVEAMMFLLANPAAAEQQAQRGVEAIRKRHTCAHRAQQLSSIFEEVLAR
ncbi:glycosyltransferase [Acidipila sp. EB88]|uniref:CgeB family protein n=1 Tax=Acidipila sp. EB88 TaxID=2305226 RepID=UPI000F5F3BB8|nr:glycosyltransferase [Acidipila sp. EB88]RRA49388.1 glycosyltransferase [Acidipila sp. EB88]